MARTHAHTQTGCVTVFIIIYLFIFACILARAYKPRCLLVPGAPRVRDNARERGKSGEEEGEEDGEG